MKNKEFTDSMIHVCYYCNKIDINTYYNEDGYVTEYCSLCDSTRTLPERIKWVSRTYEPFEITNMTADHITNTIAMLQRNNDILNNNLVTDGPYEHLENATTISRIQTNDWWIHLFTRELQKRGDK